MDAKPQKPLRPLRVFNDENRPLGGPTLHHKRHQSSPNLSILAAHATTKPVTRRVFGDNVSNTTQLNYRAVKDDCALLGKKPVLAEQKQTMKRFGRTEQENVAPLVRVKDLDARGNAFLRPAQRPLKDLSAIAKPNPNEVSNIKDIRELPLKNLIPRKQLPEKKDEPLRELSRVTEQPKLEAQVHDECSTSIPPLATAVELQEPEPLRPTHDVLTRNSFAPIVAENEALKKTASTLTSTTTEIAPSLPMPDSVLQQQLLDAIQTVSLSAPEVLNVAATSHELGAEGTEKTKEGSLQPTEGIDAEKPHLELLAAEPAASSELFAVAAISAAPSITTEAAGASLDSSQIVRLLPATVTQASEAAPLQENQNPASSLEVVHDHYDTINTGALSTVHAGEDDWIEEEEEHFDDEGFVTARSGHIYDQYTGNLTTTLMMPAMDYASQLELGGASQFVALTRDPLDVRDEYEDPSMVAEYGDEIFQYYRELEAKMQPNPHYMDYQTEIQWSMRAVLMDWLVQVHMRFGLLPETLFLTVNYVDRFLSAKVVSLNKLQLVGATALFVAAKYEEINCPSVSEICFMVEDGYTVEEVLKAERFMLSMLQFEMGWPGPMSFLRRVSKADDYDLETRTVSKYLLEVTIMDQVFIGCAPSYLAAGAHCLSRQLLDKGEWTPAHTYWSGYTYTQLYPLLVQLLHCLRAPLQHHLAVYEKHRDCRRSRGASRWVKEALRKGFKLLPIEQIEASPAYGSKHPSHGPAFGSLFW